MREDKTRIVYDVLRNGIRFKERVERGRPLDLGAVQVQLRGRLHGPAGERPADGGYLGIRYALVCWLDETFIIDSLWKDEWNRKALEPALFGDRLRAEWFWQQADLAAARGDQDKEDLEAFLLCVLLGFRGDLRNEPNALNERRAKFASEIGVSKMAEWKDAPPELPIPPTDVPELSARDRLRRILLTLGLVAGLCIFAVAFLTVFPGFGSR